MCFNQRSSRSSLISSHICFFPVYNLFVFSQDDSLIRFIYISFRQVHLGKDPMSEHSRRQVAEEREIALHEYMVRFYHVMWTNTRDS